MKNIFEHTSGGWLRYPEYEWKRAKDGNFYLMPAPKTIPHFYDPMKLVDDLVLEAVDIGRRLIQNAPEKQCRDQIKAFANKYGLLGIMTALPTTADFFKYEKVYLPRNNILREETMETYAYLKLFFPFRMLDVEKVGVNSAWNSHDDDDNYMKALMMMPRESEPMAMYMSFTRDYGERYDWMASIFRDWAFTLLGTRIYYFDKDSPSDSDTRMIIERGMSIFENNAPTFHLELLDRPTLVWDFHSLQMNIKMMLTLMMTDENNPIRLCKQCMKPFIAENPDQEFCSAECERKFRLELKDKR